MKEIKREDLKVGDEVCILITQKYCHNLKYDTIKKIKIEKITPKKTKIFADGMEFNRYEHFYQIDSDILYRDHIARTIENIYEKIAKIENLENKIASLKDKDIEKLSDILDSSYELIKNGKDMNI